MVVTGGVVGKTSLADNLSKTRNSSSFVALAFWNSSTILLLVTFACRLKDKVIVYPDTSWENSNNTDGEKKAKFYPAEEFKNGSYLDNEST